jgi:hypothetical protein
LACELTPEGAARVAARAAGKSLREALDDATGDGFLGDAQRASAAGL